jgi:hypothetical protein
MNGENEQVSEPELVESDGLAVVHKGESIFPAEGMAATLTSMGGTVVNYYFPVEIEIIGVGTANALAEEIYAALHQGLDALA